jgi:hypothetical protein
MKVIRESLVCYLVKASFAFFLCTFAGVASAQTCYMADDMDAATRTALTNAGNHYFGMMGKGDSSSLKQNAIAGLASDFSNIENAVKDNQPNFAGGQATARPPFELKAEGTAPLARAEFLCGVFGAKGQTSNSAEFIIPNLPPGNYGVVVEDVSTAKGPYSVTFVLQQQGTDWKLGGLYVKSGRVAGRDGKWYADQARMYEGKKQNLNAWFYFMEARDLLVPVSFMYTQATDKLYDESQAVKPADLPTSEKTVDLTSAGKTYKLIALFSLVVGSDLDVVVKYQAADVSDTGKTFSANMEVMKALIAKYPELRDAFAGVVTRAVEPSGRDYGSLMPMKDIK